MKNEIELKPTYWASVSGGKDSLYMLKLILSNPDKYPFIKNVVDYMEKIIPEKYIPKLQQMLFQEV